MLKREFCLFISFFASFPIFAGAQELYVGVKSELIFHSKDSDDIPFEPCDGQSSCATLEKKEKNGNTTKCTFKVKDENVSKLDTKGGRTLTVKEINRDSKGAVMSAVLDGAKAPIHLSCVSGYIQKTLAGEFLSQFPKPLDVDILSHFKEFDLGLFYYSVVPKKNDESPKQEPEKKKSTGKAI